MDRLLPPRLGALLALEPDTSFAERLRHVHEAGARAISKLGDLDLVKYEDSPIEASADLSMWEELAPVVGSTIADVNSLQAEIEVHFNESAADEAIDPRQIDVATSISHARGELRQAVMEFGMRVRDPSVVGDRWNLIAELQSFRFRFRERIGTMVFETASRLGECQRSDVDPGYEEALAATLVVRSTTADLRRLMRARIQKVSEAVAEDIEWNAKQVEKELNAFGRTAAWRALRAQDKKAILEFRQRLKASLSESMTKSELLLALEPFVEFVDGFAGINSRELLIQHDQELTASVGVVLERSMSAPTYEEGVLAFNEAVGLAQALYGRANELDAFLRKVRKTQPAPEALQPEVEQFLVLLSNLSNLSNY